MSSQYKENQKETCQTLILKAATEEFSKYGQAGARVDRIAKNANVNKAMIYYYFSSKEKLYQTIIDQYFEKLKYFLKERVVLLGDPEEIFLNLSEFYNTQLSDKLFMPILLREIADGGDSIKSSFAELLAEGPAHKLKTIIEDSIEQGRFRNIDINQAVASFVGMNLFYLFISPMINDILEIKESKKFIDNRPEAIVDLFFKGIKAK